MPDGAEFGWYAEKDDHENVLYYMLRIPNTYRNPDNPAEILTFEDGDFFVVRYNSPVEKAVGIGIGKISRFNISLLCHFFSIILTLHSFYLIYNSIDFLNKYISNNQDILHIPYIYISQIPSPNYN